MSFLPPDPARVAEWVKVFETLEAAGRFPPSTPEGRRRRAIQTISAEDRVKRLRSEARVIASLSDDERARLRPFSDAAPRPYPSKRP